MDKGIILHTILLLLGIAYFLYGLVLNSWFLVIASAVFLIAIILEIKDYIKSIPMPNDYKENKNVSNKSIYEQLREEFDERYSG